MFRKTLVVTALFATTACAALPAAANGMFGFTVNASNTREVERIRAALALYRIVRGVESGAFVHQDGALNAAAIRQVSRGGSMGVIHQDGNNHSAVLDQKGHGQNHGIFQYGNGATAHVVQTNTGQAGLTFQFGFD